MQMVKNIFLVLIILWLSLIVFTPKRSIYYTLEKELALKGVKINEANIVDGFFSLKIEGLEVYFKGINIAHIKEVNLFTLLAFSSLDIQSIKLNESFKAMLPEEIKTLHISHRIDKPFVIPIDINGSFAKIQGEANIKKRKVRLNFVSTYDIEILKRFLKKDKEGWYYETSF